jgi:glycosyltransferase 2 family protein
VVRIAISLAALWLAFGRADLAEVAGAMGAAGPLPIAMTLGVYASSQVVSAIRWLLIARATGFVLRARTAVTYYFIGMFFNFLGPSLLGGDVVRSLYLAGGHERIAAAAATVALDRYVGFVWLAVLGSVAQLAFGSFSIPVRLVWATHGLAIVALMSWFLLPAIASRRMPSGFLRVRAKVSAISVAFHGVQILAAVALARAVSPSTPWRYCFVFHPLVAIVSALPISVAGLGVRESSYVYFLASVGAAPVSEARAFAAAWLAAVTAASAIGGIIFLLNDGRLPTDRQEAARGDHSTRLPPSS